MLYALGWLFIAVLLALWSLTAWATHATAVWAVSNADVLAGAASGVQGLALPAWLAPWVPPELMTALAGMLSLLAPMVESLLQAVPALVGLLSVLIWGAWGLGAAMLLALGAGLHLLLAAWRRRGAGTHARPMGA